MRGKMNEGDGRRNIFSRAGITDQEEEESASADV